MLSLLLTPDPVACPLLPAPPPRAQGPDAVPAIQCEFAEATHAPSTEFLPSQPAAQALVKMRLLRVLQSETGMLTK